MGAATTPFGVTPGGGPRSAGNRRPRPMCRCPSRRGRPSNSTHMGFLKSRYFVVIWPNLSVIGPNLSVRVSTDRYVAICCWRRKRRARDGGQGCGAPAKPACAKRLSLTRVSWSRRKSLPAASGGLGSVELIKFEYLQLRYPWSEPNCMTRSVFRTGSNSHTVAARHGCTTIAYVAALAQENATILELGI